GAQLRPDVEAADVLLVLHAGVRVAEEAVPRAAAGLVDAGGDERPVLVDPGVAAAAAHREAQPAPGAAVVGAHLGDVADGARAHRLVRALVGDVEVGDVDPKRATGGAHLLVAADETEHPRRRAQRVGVVALDGLVHLLQPGAGAGD